MLTAVLIRMFLVSAFSVLCQGKVQTTVDFLAVFVCLSRQIFQTLCVVIDNHWQSNLLMKYTFLLTPKYSVVTSKLYLCTA